MENTEIVDLDVNIMKRLAFIKYLYENAVEQSKKVSPLSSYSILTFHDAIELFLIFAYIHLNGPKNTKDIQFFKYWELIPKLLPNEEKLTQKTSFRRLNAARVSLKHQGHLVSDIDIEAHRAAATNFFEENTKKIFGIPFLEISLVKLIRCEDAKKGLYKAMNKLKDGEYKESATLAAIAFQQIIDDYENRKKVKGPSPFYLGKPMRYMSGKKLYGQENDLSRYVDTVNESIEKLREVI